MVSTEKLPKLKAVGEAARLKAEIELEKPQMVLLRRM